MNNIMKMCQNQKTCQGVVGYNKIVTSTNDPSISTRMRYSQRVNSNTKKTITAEEFKILYGPTPTPPIPPTKNNRLFMTFFF
jgi:hypothetical protein